MPLSHPGSSYSYLTGPECLLLIGRLRRIPESELQTRIERFLELLELDNDRHQSLSRCSKGMRQKILRWRGLMCGTAWRPALVVARSVISQERSARLTDQPRPNPPWRVGCQHDTVAGGCFAAARRNAADRGRQGRHLDFDRTLAVQVALNLSIGYCQRVTWSEVVRKLKKAGFIELRTGKGSHMHFLNPRTGRRIVVVNHATQEAGNLGKRILKEAGIL